MSFTVHLPLVPYDLGSNHFFIVIIVAVLFILASSVLFFLPPIYVISSASRSMVNVPTITNIAACETVRYADTTRNGLKLCISSLD